MYPLFSSINANAFLNHIVVYVMPGEGIEIGPPITIEEALKRRPAKVVETARTREEPLKGFGTTLPEARTLVTYLALSGVSYAVASVLPELPEERIRLLKMTLPTLPIMPVDLFSRGTDMQWDKFKHTTPDTYIHNYPGILDLKVSGVTGAHDVVGLTNWRSSISNRELSFPGHLGLSPAAPYVVFDFWDQRELGVFTGTTQIQIEPHDTRVLLIHPLLDRPQFVGSSRHISGSYSILGMKWDSAQNLLGGSSQTIPGDPYSLWFHVPEGMIVSGAKAATADEREVPVRVELKGQSLKVSLTGEKATLFWNIRFARRTP